MTITYQNNAARIDWAALKAALQTNHFDNGRTPEQLERSFQNSHALCIAWSGNDVVGTARVLSDGVCNAYLIDVWTLSRFRRQGIASEMIRRLCAGLNGQHVYLQADADNSDFYRHIGFVEQPGDMSRIIGR